MKCLYKSSGRPTPTVLVLLTCLTLVFGTVFCDDGTTNSTQENDDGPCQEVGVSHVRFQTNHEGTFILQQETCDDHMMYKHEEINSYLFHVTSGAWRGWMIGTIVCSSQGSISAEDPATLPQDVQSVWREAYRGYWVSSSRLQVKCGKAESSSSSVPYTLGSVFGSLLSLAALVVFCACACHNCKSSGSRGLREDLCPVCSDVRCCKCRCTCCETMCSKLLRRSSVGAAPCVTSRSSTRISGPRSSTTRSTDSTRERSVSINTLMVRPPPYDACVTPENGNSPSDEYGRDTPQSLPPAYEDISAPQTSVLQPGPEGEGGPAHNTDLVYSVQDERVFSPPPPYRET